MIPIIARNESTLLSAADFQSCLAAVNAQLASEFRAAWGIEASVVPAPAGTNLDLPGHYNVAFKDRSDVAGDLGYHVEESTGYPAAYIFLADCAANGDPRGTVTFSHEVLEMLVDPGANLSAQGPAGIFAYETCDVTEGDTYLAPNGVKISNFVYPAYFQTNWPAGSRQFDQLKLITQPFEIRPGGYSDVLGANGWVTTWGPEANRAKARLRSRVR
jgi:hypothetical protein